MLANLIGFKDAPKAGNQSAFRIANPVPVMNKGKLTVWENIPYNGWQHAARIMSIHSENTDPVSLVRRLDDSELEFLDKASDALAFLGRLAPVLPELPELIRHPRRIEEFLYYPFLTKAFNGTNSTLPDTPQARFALAWWIAMIGAMFRIRTRFARDYPVARAICAVLFSRPYRADWATCEISGMEQDAELVHAMIRKHSPDFMSDVWHRDVQITIRAGTNSTNHIFYLASNIRALRQLAKSSGKISLKAPKNRIAWEWVPEHIPVFYGRRYLGPLPQVAAGLPVNLVSGAYAPMYTACDDCDMPIALIPESPEIWDAMLHLYGMPKRDPLYPESREVLNQLSPRNAQFGADISETHALVYLGIKSLGEFVPELPDADNPDYQFHTFMADVSKWKRGKNA